MCRVQDTAARWKLRAALERQRRESIERIVASLARYSGLDYGTNVERWTEWAEKRRSSEHKSAQATAGSATLSIGRARPAAPDLVGPHRALRDFVDVPYCLGMTLTELQNAIRLCSKEDQDQLAAFLTILRQQRDPEYLATLDARINDRDPQHWVSLEALKEQFRND